MRYGKNQGCDFLYKDCEVNDDSKNYFSNLCNSNYISIFYTTLTN